MVIWYHRFANEVFGLQWRVLQWPYQINDIFEIAIYFFSHFPMSQKERYISCKWCKRLILLINLARIYFHFLLELRFWKLKVHAYTSVALLACREGWVRTSDFIWARVIKEVSEPIIRKFNNNIGRFAFECEMEYWQTGVIFVEWIEFVVWMIYKTKPI